LRNGAPFKDWDLPPALTQVRVKLKQHADGDRQFVKVLGAVPAILNGLAWVGIFCFLEPWLLIQGRGADSQPSPDRAT